MKKIVLCSLAALLSACSSDNEQSGYSAGIYGDNGGSQRAAMQGLYRNHNAASSLGDILAFAALMQRNRGLGSLDDVYQMQLNMQRLRQLQQMQANPR